MATTPVQRIFNITAKRCKNAACLTRDQIVDRYNDKTILRLSTKSEPISKGWVDSAFAIWDRALSTPTIQ